MRDTDQEMIFKSVGGSALLPVNQLAHEFCLDNHGEVCVKDITTRDLSFMRAYFGMLKFIYNLLPPKFKNRVSQENFYKFLKHVQGQYEILYTFNDGSKMIEYKSISFGRMTQTRFKEYVRNQLPIIYEDVIGVLFTPEETENIITIIEDEWENYLSRLS